MDDGLGLSAIVFCNQQYCYIRTVDLDSLAALTGFYHRQEEPMRSRLDQIDTHADLLKLLNTPPGATIRAGPVSLNSHEDRFVPYVYPLRNTLDAMVQPAFARVFGRIVVRDPLLLAEQTALFTKAAADFCGIVATSSSLEAMIRMKFHTKVDRRRLLTGVIETQQNDDARSVANLTDLLRETISRSPMAAFGPISRLLS